ncbi:CehA/McbA family metallohydrolase [Nonomuraea sp. NPDC046570]|uniref:CehA/McbA family metallohydrolase n=1 Tax=Nonomuraea sp. NPDC046570 TaxID=3155255 RepID=UPI0033C24A87
MSHDPMLPEPVARMLEDYRELLAEHGMTWGEPPLSYVRVMSPSRFMEVGPFWREARLLARELAPGGDAADREIVERELDYDEVLRNTLGKELPAGLAVLRLTPDGHDLRSKTQVTLGGRPLPCALLVDNACDQPVTVVAGTRPYEVGARGAKLIDLDTATPVQVDGRTIDLRGFTRDARRARVRLRAGFPCRWSIWTADGQGWYPEGAPARRDYHGLPYFHGDDLVVDVPAEPLTIRVARGMEYGIAETTLTPPEYIETLVELAPKRIYDAAAMGWYGADLHVHLNATGDLVAPPKWAADAQFGEDLHVLSLLAANVSGSRVLDREALEHWAGQDLPWSDATHVARMGAEHRNDLFGHLHAFAPSAPPSLYSTGFQGAPDWPPTTAALRELRELGALVGYAHAFRGATETPEQLVGTPGCTARMAVVDAALGLVDGFELLHFSCAHGSANAYRRLIGAGNRIAAVAGTDSVLTLTRHRMEMVASPVGWERTYARVRGALSAASYAEAVRAGRTFATTGPFLELAVEGHGPGDTLDLLPGETVMVSARAIGPEVRRLSLLTADGELAAVDGARVSAELTVRRPTYVVAVAEGGAHPRSLFSHVYAHTSPVYLDVEHRRVAREDDVNFCLRWIDLLEQLVREGATLDGERQLGDYLEVIEEARRVYLSRLP